MWQDDYLDPDYATEYWEDLLYEHEQCCKTCKYFRGRFCRNSHLDEFSLPSPDGSDCCDLWEERRRRR